MPNKVATTTSSPRTLKEANRLFALSIFLCCVGTAILLYLVHLGLLNFLIVAIIQWIGVVYFTLTQNQ
ncbi:MAG: hypothetical protein AAGK47_00415 [Bacteroidota bacterium]